MSKFESQLQNVKTALSQPGNVLVALPANASIDKIAAGLSLYLALKNSGKEATIVSPDTLTVSQSNLFGVGEVQGSVPTGGAGNFVISLEGVVDNSTGNPIVSSLEKLDWFPEGNNLNLVFHIAKDQKFEPTKVNQFYQNSATISTIFVIGAAALSDLGIIYQNHQDTFTKAHIVNIDNNSANTNFGATNVVDGSAGTLSEMILQMLPDLGFAADSDIASNILTGIYDATANLTSNTSADTFIAVGQAMQYGGKTQVAAVQQAQFQTQPQSQPETQVKVEAQPQPEVQPQVEVQSAPQAPQAQQAPVQPVMPTIPQETNASGFDLSQIFNLPKTPGNDQFTNPSVVNPAEPAAPQHSSPEERPMGEYATSPNPEVESTPTPDWLVPKIFKGGNVG